MTPKNNRKKGYGFMVALTIVLTILGMATLFPDANASKENIFGYASHCTFSPWSTLICLLLAGINCRLRVTFFTEH